MPSIFTKIINREVPGHIIAENDNFIAFLDIQPLVHGHVLVVPKKEVNYIFDLEDELYTGLFQFAKTVAKAIGSKIECKRVGVAVIGLEVPHVHIHLVPLNSMTDINFSRPKLEPSQDELKEIAERIRSAM